MNFEETFPLRFYLNLGRRDDRRAATERELLLAGISAERFPAIDHRWVNSSRGFETPQRYACALSHRLAIREAKRRNAEAVLIFEDDVILAPDFLDRVSKIELPENWGVLYLGCAHNERPTLVSPGLVKVSYALDCHAYAIHHQYFDLLLKALASIPRGRNGQLVPSDALLAQLVEKGKVPGYALFPNAAWQSVSKSEITDTVYSHYGARGEQQYLHYQSEGLHAEALGLKPSKYAAEPPKKRLALPTPRQAHVAFLFLTRDNLSHPRIWEEYLQEHPDRYDLFVHPKDKEAVTQELIRDRIISDLEETAWGDVSLVRATLKLLRAAFQNPETTHFVLCSENCLPTKPFARFLEFLFLDGRSWIHHKSVKEIRKVNFVKSKRFEFCPEIPAECARFQEQWMILERRAVEDLLADDFTEAFEPMFAPDEAYFITLLRLKGFPLEWINNQPSTWTRWAKGKSHPTSFPFPDRELFSELFTSAPFFARKFPVSEALSDYHLHLPIHEEQTS